MAKIKYKIISYDNYEDPVVKIESEIDLLDTIYFDEAIDYIVGQYDKSYLQRQIYVQDLCEMTWCKFFDLDFIINKMELDSYHYKWLHERLCDVQQSFGLLDNELEIVIDGPGIGRNVDSFEGIDIIIKTAESGHDNNPHVHAEYSGEELWIYIATGEVRDNKSFKSPSKTKKAINYVKENRKFLLDKWNKITNSNLTIDAIIKL